MAAVELYLFLQDNMDVTSNVTMSASSTVVGYAVDNAREADLYRSWKGNDSTTTDEWLQVDGALTTWIGGAGATAFCAVALDNRGAHQEQIKLQHDGTNPDTAAMASPVDDATFSLSNTDTEIRCRYASFTIATPAKRYYRLLQPGDQRTESSGTITTKILKWGMYPVSGVIRLETDWPSEAEGAHEMSEVHRVGTVRTAGGQTLSNMFAQAGQRFTVTFQPASEAFKDSLFFYLRSVVGTQRAFFVQKTALRSMGQGAFMLCRMVADPQVRITYRGYYDVTLSFETEPWL